MKIKNWLFSLTALACYSTAVGQNNPLTKYLPAEAGSIISFNPVKMANKVPGEAFRQSAMYREMMKDDDGELKAFMSDPGISGIDFSQDLLVTITSDTTDGNTGANVALFGVLKNEALFSLLINKLNKGKVAVETFGTNKIMLSSNNAPAIAWNNEIFVITGGNKGAMTKEMMNIYMDTTESNPKSFDKKLEELNYKMKLSLRKTCFELLSPKAPQPFTASAKYAALLGQTGDFKIWSNGKTFSGTSPKMPYMLAGIFSKLQNLSASEKISTVNFDNGMISGTVQNFINEEMAAVYKKYPLSKLNTDLTRRLPNGKVLALMVSSMEAGMVKEMAQKSGLVEIMDSLKGHLPFDFNLVTNAFKNNMLLAVMKMPTIPKEPAEGEEYRNKAFDGLQFILAMPITDKAKFEELKNAVTKTIDSLKGDGEGQPGLKGFKPVIKYNDSLLVISMSEEVSTAFLNNPGTAAAPEWLSSFAQYPMAMNINMKELVKMILTKGNDTEEGLNPTFKKIVDRFDQMIMTGGDYANGSLNSRMEFRFSNPNENAMKQLFDIMNDVIDMSSKMTEDAINQGRKRNYTTEEVTIVDVKQEDNKLPPPPPPPPPPKPPVKKKKG